MGQNNKVVPFVTFKDWLDQWTTLVQGGKKVQNKNPERQ